MAKECLQKYTAPHEGVQATDVALLLRVAEGEHVQTREGADAGDIARHLREGEAERLRTRQGAQAADDARHPRVGKEYRGFGHIRMPTKSWSEGIDVGLLRIRDRNLAADYHVGSIVLLLEVYRKLLVIFEIIIMVQGRPC